MFGALRLGLGLSPAKGGFDWYPNRLFQSGDILLWYDPSDLTTMFKDTAGTQPVTADGDSVALMLDKGQWGGKSLTQVLAGQAELSPNIGPYGDTDDWTATNSGTLASVSGELELTAGATFSGAYILAPVTAEKFYEATFTARRGTATAAYISVLNNNTGTIIVNGFGNANLAIGASSTVIRCKFLVPAGCTNVRLAVVHNNQPNGRTLYASSVSIKEIPGYHRIQATGTSMPKYKTGPNPAAAENSPELVTNGTFDTDLTGWTIIDATRGTAVASGGRAVLTNNHALGSTVGFTGIIAAVSTEIGTWYRYKANLAGTAGMSASNNSNGTASFAQVTGTGNKQLTFQATATTTYLVHYVNWAADAATANFDDTSLKEIPASAPYIHWLLYDGTDDSNATGTITWGTDEVAICAGVTKSSDSGAAPLVESSASSSTNAGSFAIFAPYTNSTANYGFRSRGSASSDAASAGYAAPTTNVLTGQGKISTDVSTLRADGAQVATSATDQGTGNYGSHVLYFGRRAGTSLPFNGREYQTVIRSRLLSAAELSKLETFVAAKTGVIL